MWIQHTKAPKLSPSNGILVYASALVTVLIPAYETLLPEAIYPHIEQALAEAEEQGISGKKTTPFLLKRLVVIMEGASLNANLALLKNNAAIAAQIVVEFSKN